MNLKTLLSNDLKPKSLRLVPVVVEDIGDLETPVSAFLKLRRRGAKFLLESVEQNEKVGRYSFIGLDPKITIRVDEDRIVFTENSILSTGKAKRKNQVELPTDDNPLGALRKILNSLELETHQGIRSL